MQTLSHDIRYGVRVLLKQPGFTLLLPRAPGIACRSSNRATRRIAN